MNQFERYSQLKGGEVLSTHELPDGAVIEFVRCNIDATEGKGMHIVAQFRGQLERSGITSTQLAGIFLQADLMGQKLSEEFDAPGRYRLELNGPRAASKPHVHAHIVIVPEDFKLRRCVDPIRRA